MVAKHVAQRVEHLRSTGGGFKYYSGQKLRNKLTTLGKLFTPMCPVTKQYNLPAKGR